MKNNGPLIDRPIFGLAVVLAVAVVLFWLDRGYGEGWFSWAYWKDGGGNTSRSEVVRNLVIVGVGLIGLVAGIWRAWTAHRQAQAAQMQATAAVDQWRISEQGQITDRYSEAVKMLSADNARTRTGAIYALARIAQDSVDRDHIPVMEVLTEFIRNPPYQEEAAERAEARRAEIEAIEIGAAEPAAPEVPPPVQCPDIHAALKVIGERNDAQKEREKEVSFVPHFRHAALQELNLRRAILTDAILTEAIFVGADLIDADLSGAILTYTDLADTALSGANLADANLFYAELSDAILVRADLTDADLSNADLTDADLFGAILTNTTGLTHGQIARSRPNPPPDKLPNRLDWPFVQIGGKWERRE